MSKQYICDNPSCRIEMDERYPDPADESADFCSERCYLSVNVENRRLGHSALRWNKGSKTIEKFDPHGKPRAGKAAQTNLSQEEYLSLVRDAMLWRKSRAGKGDGKP